MNKIIGIGGVARSGKDTLGWLLKSILKSKGYSAKTFSLATPLKDDLAEFVWNNWGIDVWDCSDVEKDLIRPLMVAYGTIQRNLTDGSFFVDEFDKKYKAEKSDFSIITDIRYAEREEKDELAYLRRNNATLIYVARYKQENGEKEYIQPANDHEERNDPILRENADIILEWPSFGDTEAHSKGMPLVKDLYERNQSFFHEIS